MAGRRAGKTYAIQRRLVHDALKYPGHKSYYLTPDGALCNEVFRELAESWACRRRILKIEHSPVRQIFWRNGSRTFFRMFDRPDKSLGLGFDVAYFDEIQKLRSLEGKEAFMRVIRPLIMDRQGSLIVAGQWRGRGCWWYKWFEANKTNPKYKIYSLPSWVGHCFRSGRENHPEILEARETMPRVIFDQEIACIPTSAENAAFNLYDIEGCFGGEILDKGIHGHEYAIGADLGRSRDPSAWVVMDMATSQIVHAARRPLGENHDVGAMKLAELSAKYNGAQVLFDATGGATGGKYEPDSFVKLYRNLVPNSRWIFMPVTVKTSLIQALSLTLEQRRIRIPVMALDLIDEMNLYEVKYNGYNYSYSAPKDGGHDDLVVALALANNLCSRGSLSGNSVLSSAMMG